MKTAKEMAENTINRYQEMVFEEKKSIENKVCIASNYGRTSIYFETMYPENIEWLETLGYKVTEKTIITVEW